MSHPHETALPQGFTCGNVTLMDVIGYARVSTDEQARSGLGLEAQRRAIRAAVNREGWHLAGLVVDEGQSAKSLDRPGLLEAVERVARGEAQALVVAKLDRLTRSLVGLADLLEWGERVGVGIVALDLSLDTSTSSGRLLARVMASVGEWEREQISERTRAAADVRRTAGQRMGRAGVRDSRPDLAERIKRERVDGGTWQAIADGLNDDGVPTIRGGALWRVSAVQSAAGYVRPAARARRVEAPDACASSSAVASIPAAAPRR